MFEKWHHIASSYELLVLVLVLPAEVTSMLCVPEGWVSLLNSIWCLRNDLVIELLQEKRNLPPKGPGTMWNSAYSRCWTFWVCPCVFQHLSSIFCLVLQKIQRWCDFKNASCRYVSIYFCHTRFPALLDSTYPGAGAKITSLKTEFRFSSGTT